MRVFYIWALSKGMLGIEGEGISYNNKILMIPSGNLTWLLKMAYS
jgi:hypothetical protein